ncbi:Glycoprotein membrane GPI-anchored protein [Quillaja saponaria]|uniref:Glycoprotein membrane GPI-anchored protein n=1 Tax=Quillaja saponaria TaxID=32244 RepID=A0AAD7VLE9_QUISA|nr:Glycoprotein membrane GPI-anchored protein [Quillaja saponaria]
MASTKFSLLLPLLLSSILLMNHLVNCDEDEEDNLLQGINKYRASFNLKALTKNDNAKCLADELSEQFKKQPCTNTTGANTIPGTEPQFANYPNLLAKCHLNVSNTRDGVVMPACIPSLVPSLVLTNFTQSRYSDNLNDTKFTGVGIGSEDNWIVVVLTTNTPDGSFVPTTNTPDSSTLPYSAADMVSKISLIYLSLLFLIGSLFLL